MSEYGTGYYGLGVYGTIPTAPFASWDDATLAIDKTTTAVVVIGGQTVHCREWSTDHGIRQPVGTANLVIDADDNGDSLPDTLALNSTVTIQAGYDNLVGYCFQGRIPDRAITFTDDGTVAHISASGYGRWFSRRSYSDIGFAGPITLKTIYQSLAAVRGVPNALADDTTYPDGVTPILLGGIDAVDGGEVVIPADTSSQQWINQLGNLFGYYSFDVPSGLNRLQLIAGKPAGAPVATFREGDTGYEYEVRDDMAGMVTYWEIKGARYTDDDGQTVAVRSIPLEVPYDELLEPDGYIRDSRSSEYLVTTALADAVRNVHELDYSAPDTVVTWHDEGRPDIEPGDVVHVTAPSIGVDADLWVLSTQHTYTDADGFSTTFTGWAGAGAALPAGNDCVITPIAGGPWHLGDEYLSHYAVPSPSTGPIKLPFDVDDNYTSITVRALAHGTNSYMLSGKNADSTVSRFEVYQFGEKVGEGEMPVLSENLANAYPYGESDTYWSNLVIPVSGTLEPGSAELHIISGNDTRASGGPRDDFEVKNVTVTVCGIGEPVLPTVREA